MLLHYKQNILRLQDIVFLMLAYYSYLSNTQYDPDPKGDCYQGNAIAARRLDFAVLALLDLQRLNPNPSIPYRTLFL